MRSLFVLFCLITVNASAAAAPIRILSQSCSYKYVEGKKYEWDGKLLIECIHKNFLAESYMTHLNDDEGHCTRGFIEGRKFVEDEYFNTMICLRESSLGTSYETYTNTQCAEGYLDTFDYHPIRFDYPYKVCVLK